MVMVMVKLTPGDNPTKLCFNRFPNFPFTLDCFVTSVNNLICYEMVKLSRKKMKKKYSFMSKKMFDLLGS